MNLCSISFTVVAVGIKSYTLSNIDCCVIVVTVDIVTYASNFLNVVVSFHNCSSFNILKIIKTSESSIFNFRIFQGYLGNPIHSPTPELLFRLDACRQLSRKVQPQKNCISNQLRPETGPP